MVATMINGVFGRLEPPIDTMLERGASPEMIESKLLEYVRQPLDEMRRIFAPGIVEQVEVELRSQISAQVRPSAKGGH